MKQDGFLPGGPALESRPRRSPAGHLRTATAWGFHAVRPALEPILALCARIDVLALSLLVGRLSASRVHRAMGWPRPWPLRMPSDRRLVRQNLGAVFPGEGGQARAASLARAHARFLSGMRLDAALWSRHEGAGWDDSTQLHGLHHAESVLAGGRGVLLLGCHAGYVYRAMVGLARRGFQVNVLTMRPRDTSRTVWRGAAGLALYGRVLAMLEREPNVRLLFAGEAGRGTRRVLSSGGLLLTAFDNPLPPATDPAPGVRVPFLGVAPRFSDRLLRTAAECGARCVPYLVTQFGPISRVSLHPVLEPGPHAGPQEAAHRLARLAMGLFERHILAFPAQWWLWRDFGAFVASTGPTPADQRTDVP